MAEGIRLFIGVRVSMATVRSLTETVDALREAADAAKLRVRWVDPTAYHVTLKFIGWTRVEAVEAIEDAVGRALAGRRGFAIDCAGLGAFPKLSKARVLWAGIDDPRERLSALARAIDGATAELGYKKETRPFHAHVTLGRLKPVADIESIVETAPEQAFRNSLVSSVVLFESKMKSDGSEYVVRAEWPLEADSRGPKRHTRRVEQSDHGDEQGHSEGQIEDSGQG